MVNLFILFIENDIQRANTFRGNEKKKIKKTFGHR